MPLSHLFLHANLSNSWYDSINCYCVVEWIVWIFSPFQALIHLNSQNFLNVCIHVNLPLLEMALYWSVWPALRHQTATEIYLTHSVIQVQLYCCVQKHCMNHLPPLYSDAHVSISHTGIAVVIISYTSLQTSQVGLDINSLYVQCVKMQHTNCRISCGYNGSVKCLSIIKINIHQVIIATLCQIEQAFKSSDFL